MYDDDDDIDEYFDHIHDNHDDQKHLLVGEKIWYFVNILTFPSVSVSSLEPIFPQFCLCGFRIIFNISLIRCDLPVVLRIENACFCDPK